MEHFNRYANTYFQNLGEPLVLGVYPAPFPEKNLPDRKYPPGIYPSQKYPLGNYPEQKIPPSTEFPLENLPSWKVPPHGRYILPERKLFQNFFPYWKFPRHFFLLAGNFPAKNIHTFPNNKYYLYEKKNERTLQWGSLIVLNVVREGDASKWAI